MADDYAGAINAYRRAHGRLIFCATRAGSNVVGRTFRRIAALLLCTQLLFGLMPKFIFPAFRPAVALPDLVSAIEDLLFRGAFHERVPAGGHDLG